MRSSDWSSDVCSSDLTDGRVLPIIGDCFDQGRFPTELIPEIAGLGLLGATLPEEYGGAGLNGVSYGLICQELERGDRGLRSFASVQRSEERRVGKEWVSKWRSRWGARHEKQKK